MGFYMSSFVRFYFFKATFVCFLSALLSTCVTSSKVESSKIQLFQNSNRQADAASKLAVRSEQGIVSAAHPLASIAGASMLSNEGNAIDAAVASSFVISVVRPQSTGIGGGGFLLFHDASSSRQRVYDFRERAPAGATPSMYLETEKKYKTIRYRGHKVTNPAVNGHLSVAVPGLVKGLLEVHKKYGRLSLSTVMAPAIDIADKGFEVYPVLAEAIEARKEFLNIYPGSQKIFLPGGKPLKAGDRLIQKDLANTLRIIAAEGEKAFYDGILAGKIIDEMRRGGGIISRSDLRSYRMVERVPVTGRYRDFRIVSMPPPSSGGTHIIEMLNMLEPFDLPKMDQRGTKYLHLLSEVMRRAFSDRAQAMGDSDFVDVPIAKLTSKSHANELMKSFQEGRASRSSDFGQTAPTGESPSTTHISVIDKWGNAVSTTQTINYSFGSCVVAEGTGIVLNDEMDDFTTMPGSQNVFGLITGEKNKIAPGKRPLSSMSPTMVFDKSGKLQLVVGSPGGPRIINATLQAIINYIDFKLPLDQAVHSTRIHHQWFPDVIRFEPNSLDPDVERQLKKLGHTLMPMESIGDVQAAQRLSNGQFVGVSDMRGEGVPASPQ
jgi:gamma-glutamyltranspeptidase / glutathione hydrolase